MLSNAQLARLDAETRGRKVLNVFVNARETDAVGRLSWRTTLESALTRTRKALADAPHAERNALDGAAARVLEMADRWSAHAEAGGWVAFVTEDAVVHEEARPVGDTPMVAWRDGVATLAYVCLPPLAPPVLAVLVNARSARILRWAGGALSHVDTIHAHAQARRAGHMGDAPREHFHGGTRGTTTSEAMQRTALTARERMMRELADRLQELAGSDAVIVIGGTPVPAREAWRALSHALTDRALQLGGFSIWATEAEIVRAAQDGAARLARAQQSARVATLLERAGARETGITGAAGTLLAVRAGAGRDVLFTPRFVTRHPDDAELLVREGLTHGAELLEVSGEAAEQLDATGGGVGALLRFPPLRAAAPPATAG
ncbi:MAG TPA: hypothetical protein VG818_12630 [Gemmatimonadaceae bacterium]|nr:hypothetical protein [Gemmatimonadaceae bacterium]